jgi:homoserine O-acetyltransferase
MAVNYNAHMSTSKHNNYNKMPDKLNRVSKLFQAEYPFEFECGKSIPSISIAYETYGRLNKEKSNAILICHALTGSAYLAGKPIFSNELLQRSPLLGAMARKTPGWWDDLVGPGRVFDTDRFYIISSNIMGSCYGSSGPASINPESGKKYGPDFPQVTVRDIVHAERELIHHLGIEKLHAAIGGSLGGMQVLEWALMFPSMINSIVPIGTSARHSDWCIGLNNIARQAIMNDPDWQEGHYQKQPEKGLALARKVGMVSYRSDISFNARFGYERILPENDIFKPENIFQVESYLNYQGTKLVERFDANSYLYLTRAMDSHDITRDRGSLEEVLRQIKTRTLCIGIDSDILYPAHEQKSIAAAIPWAQYSEIKSINGHDAFLIEFDQISAIIGPFLSD